MGQCESVQTKKPGIGIGLALIFALVSGASQAESPGDLYEMLVITDQAFGEALIAGELEDAIEGITAQTQRRGEIFAAQTNLCVAYIRANQARKAKVACESAVTRSRRASRHNQAIALSNLGVFRAITGDSEGAMHSFRAAMRLTNDLSAPAVNLERLTQLLGQEMASK